MVIIIGGSSSTDSIKLLAHHAFPEDVIYEHASAKELTAHRFFIISSCQLRTFVGTFLLDKSLVISEVSQAWCSNVYGMFSDSTHNVFSAVSQFLCNL